MARIRTIKPEFFDDEHLGSLPFQHRLGYIGLILQADKAGRLEDRPKRLKARIFPFDAVDMELVLSDLAREDFVVRYVVEGRAYLAIKPSSWEKHQRPRSDEPESVLPSPSGDRYTTLGPFEEIGTSLRRQKIDSDGFVTAETLGKEGKGKEGKGIGESLEPQAASKPEARQDVLLNFPVVGSKKSWWELTSSHVAEWAGLFPGLDVLAEARKALAWIGANPGRRKTSRGMPRFLVGWFSRTIDRKGVGATVIAPQQPRIDATLTAWLHDCKRLHNSECGLRKDVHDARCAKEKASDDSKTQVGGCTQRDC